MPNIFGMRVFFALFALVMMAATVGPASAGQNDARLNVLFERLQKTQDENEAKALQKAIWSIWARSDDATVNRLMQRGIAAMNAGDNALALAAFNRVIEIRPDFAEAYDKRATLYFLTRRFDAAVRDIAKTLELEPRHFGALTGLALINVAMGRDKAAIRAIERALELNPHIQGAAARLEELRDSLKGTAI